MKFINHKCLCNRDIRRNFTFVNIRVVPLLAIVKRVFSYTCSLNREEHKAIIVLTTWISKCVLDILMCVLFPISTHKSLGLSTKPALTLLISYVVTLNGGLSWKTPSILDIYIKSTFWWKCVYWKDITFHIGHISKVSSD